MKTYETNNFPFSYKGVIKRLPYFYTKLVIFIVQWTSLFILSGTFSHFYEIKFDNIYLNRLFYSFIKVMLIASFAANVFATAKRLNDIRAGLWLLVIWFIPGYGGLLFLPLFFIKSKT